MVRSLPPVILSCLLAVAWGGSWAQQQIFTCVDAKGRRLTSDRPIAECVDREQKELNASGTVRRSIAPTPTALERAAQEERERKEAEDRLRQAEERRMQRALVIRYPTQAVHDLERSKALKAAQDAMGASQRRIVELQQQRKQLDAEAEFYPDRSKWPAKLKREIEDIEQQIAAQQRIISIQQEEKLRIDKRFDQELAKLRGLWSQVPTAAAAPVAPVAR
jgi:hypothetical protein